MAPAPLSFVGLGSNIGDRLSMLRAARGLLSRLADEQSASAVYETAPVGPPQADYLNAVMAVRSPRPPVELLEDLLQIERALGRERKERWGPRTIDLDLLATEGSAGRWPSLVLPHPEIARRAFVLRPWLDLAPGFEVAGQGTVQALWDALPESERQQVRQFSVDWNAASH